MWVWREVDVSIDVNVGVSLVVDMNGCEWECERDWV